jgi:hypothetical protein
MQNQGRPKKFAKATWQGTGETGRPCERWRKEVEEDLNIMGIETRNQWSDTFGKGGIFCWTPKSATERRKR